MLEATYSPLVLLRNYSSLIQAILPEWHGQNVNQNPIRMGDIAIISEVILEIFLIRNLVLTVSCQRYQHLHLLKGELHQNLDKMTTFFASFLKMYIFHEKKLLNAIFVY